MKKMILLSSLLFSSLVIAQEPTKPSDPVVPASTIAAVIDPAVAALASTDPSKISDADVKEVLANADEVLAAYQAVKTADGAKAKFLTIFAGLAVLFKLLLSLMKVVVKADFWKGAKAKWIIRCGTAALGLAVFLCANLGAGVPWYDAILMGLSGPFAIVVHEFTSKPRASDEAKKA